MTITIQAMPPNNPWNIEPYTTTVTDKQLQNLILEYLEKFKEWNRTPLSNLITQLTDTVTIKTARNMWCPVFTKCLYDYMVRMRLLKKPLELVWWEYWQERA